MSASSLATSAETTKRGSFNYLQQGVEHSLYRNGLVLTRRDKDGSDGDTQGVLLTDQLMDVHDARALAPGEHRTLAANGFELCTRPVGDPQLDFLDHQQVVHNYYDDCVAVLREASGSPHVFAFDHNIRSALGEKNQQRIAGGQQVQGPAHVVHGDYTLISAPDRLRALAKPPSGNDTLRPVLPEGTSLLDPQAVDHALSGGRYAIINVWRNIADEPVAMHPLALCDAQTVDPQDLVVFEIHYQDRIGENYFAKHSARHRWYSYPGLTREEALLIKQWDSAGELALSNGARADSEGQPDTSTFSFHSAFEDPSTRPDSPERWSIEVRCLVLYE